MKKLHCKNLTLYLKDGSLTADINGRRFPPFFLCIAGRYDGSSAALTTQGNRLPEEFVFMGEREENGAFCLRYAHGETGLEVECVFEKIESAGILRQTNLIRNCGNHSVTVTHFSSGLLNGIAIHPSRGATCGAKLHYIRQNWEGEGQIETQTVEEAGIERVSTHPITGAFHLSSKGGYTTGRYYPQVFLEDANGQLWFIGLESEGNWHLECGYLTDYDGDPKGEGFYLEADELSLRHNDSWHTLAPGESLRAAPAYFGCAADWDEAAAGLAAYRRRNTVVSAESPLVFNDYMNCLWGDPTEEKMLPLIDRAAELGAEIYCTDAGWYSYGSWGDVLGDWEPADQRFGERKFSGIISYIRQKGMLAGCWMEMEVCGEHSELYRKPDDWFLTRFGKRIGGGSRVFLNMTSPHVREYLTGKVERLYRMGVRYIKNDYNDCPGNGCSLEECPAEGIAANHRAAMAFYGELQRRFPGLMIENCGSGAMRCDEGTLRYFTLQSTSDQEYYMLYPSIVQGMGLMVAPDKMGIWAYPFPQIFERRGDDGIFTNEYMCDMQDGEQTIFNMVTALCGVPYLSGRIDKADDANFAFIHEGTDFYLENREFLHRAHPVYPIGFASISDSVSPIAYGLTDGKELLLAVWRREGPSETVVDLAKYFQYPQVRLAYPMTRATDFSLDKNRLTVKLPKPNTARMFRIREGNPKIKILWNKRGSK